MAGPMDAVDFLAVVSRPTFPNGSGTAGDYYNLRALINRRSDWNAVVLELNSRSTTVEWDGRDLIVRQEGVRPVSVNSVRTALFLPICLEVEETLLCPFNPGGSWPRFETEQWRSVSAAFEDRLSNLADRTGGRCLNRPDRVRVTNNKMIQFEQLAAAGFSLPPAVVSGVWPQGTPLGQDPVLVAKNVSEGGWKSEDEFSPARLVQPETPTDPWPTIWQRPIVSDLELRCYVTGDRVTVVELTRDPAVLDVRSTNGGQPLGRIVDVPDRWEALLLAMTRCLGLDYAVIDAIPSGDELHVLEVNANGVWWFLPPDIAAALEARFHTWLESEIDGRPSA